MLAHGYVRPCNRTRPTRRRRGRHTQPRGTRSNRRRALRLPYQRESGRAGWTERTCCNLHDRYHLVGAAKQILAPRCREILREKGIAMKTWKKSRWHLYILGHNTTLTTR